MTTAELDALKAARDSGVATVSYMGRTVTYRSLAEIERIIKTEEARLAGSRYSFMRIRTRRDSGG